MTDKFTTLQIRYPKNVPFEPNLHFYSVNYQQNKIYGNFSSLKNSTNYIHVIITVIFSLTEIELDNSYCISVPDLIKMSN